ncbi:hypothetical protein ACFZAV_45470 [Streptomyces sp. NPDC008343]|uniref:hypothetical protein n=1 Tax=Streptomyces sp. NPDC008343 TaxID=3364828 RepID=UPI0036F071E8
MRTDVRRVITGAGSVLAAAILVTGVAGAAHGADANFSVGTKEQPGYISYAGVATFIGEGEHFRVVDNDEDGAGVRGQVFVEGTLVSTVTNTGGYGHTDSVDLNITDDKDVTIKVCISNNGSIVSGTCREVAGQA